MSASKEKWMLFSTFVLTMLFVTFFIWPNYQQSASADLEAASLELRIEQLERRRIEVEQLRKELSSLKQFVDTACKFVPTSPDMSSIVQSLSLEIDGHRVADQSFTAVSLQRNKMQVNLSFNH